MQQIRRRRPGRSVVAAGAAVVAVSYGLVRFGYGLHLSAFTAEFGLSAALAGVIAAGGFTGYCVSALLARWLISLGYLRRTLWSACALASLGSLLTAGAWSSASLAAGVVIAGSAAGAASPALVAAVAATVAAGAADRSQAIVNSGAGLGVVVGGLSAALVADHWRLLWVGFAVAAVLVTAWVDRCTTWPAPASRAPASRPPAARAPADRPPADRAPADRPRVWTDLALLRRCLAAASLAGAGSAAVWTFGRDLLTVTGGSSAATTALLWCVLGGAGVLGAASGDLVRRLGLRPTWVSAAVAMAAATAVLVVRPDLAPLAGGALAVFGGSYVVLSGVLIVYATRVTPDRAAGSTATLFVAFTAGQAVGAAVLGATTAATSQTTSFLIAAGLILLSCPAILGRRGRAASSATGTNPSRTPGRRRVTATP